MSVKKLEISADAAVALRSIRQPSALEEAKDWSLERSKAAMEETNAILKMLGSGEIKAGAGDDFGPRLREAIGIERGPDGEWVLKPEASGQVRQVIQEQANDDAALVAAHADSGMSRARSLETCTAPAMGWTVDRHDAAWNEAERLAQQNALAHGQITPLTPNTRRRIAHVVSDAETEAFRQQLEESGVITDHQEQIAQRISESIDPKDTREDVQRKIQNIVKGLSQRDARRVVTRAEQLLREQETRLQRELGQVRRTHQHADDIIRGVVDPMEKTTPLMSRLLQQHNGQSATDYLEKFWDQASKKPTGGWEDRLADDMSSWLAGKATIHGRPATEQDIKDSLESVSGLMKGMSANARAVYRIIITTSAGQSQRQEGGFTIDIGQMLEIAKWSETAALKFWADPVFKEQAGSAAAYEARLTVIARLMREVAERTELGPLEFTYAVFVILIWWQADERPANYVAEETVHAVLQAGSENGPSPWTEPTLLWLGDWWQSAFSRINVGHKLAAALALTDVPADVPHSPWKAWSLLIPDGMFQNTDKVAGWDLVAHSEQDRGGGKKLTDLLENTQDNTWTGVRLRRAWFRGTELVGLVADWFFEGDHMEAGKVAPISLTCAVASIGEESMRAAVGQELVDMVRSLGLGVLAAITNQPAQKTGQWGITKKRPGKKKPERIQLGEVWDVASPVTIDLREHVRSIQLGKTRARSAPTAAWVVRGHWRNQVHGEGRTLRRRQWIEPYWKGDESMRRLMRGVEVKE